MYMPMSRTTTATATTNISKTFLPMHNASFIDYLVCGVPCRAVPYGGSMHRCIILLLFSHCTNNIPSKCLFGRFVYFSIWFSTMVLNAQGLTVCFASVLLHLSFYLCEYPSTTRTCRRVHWSRSRSSPSPASHHHTPSLYQTIQYHTIHITGLQYSTCT